MANVKEIAANYAGAVRENETIGKKIDLFNTGGTAYIDLSETIPSTDILISFQEKL
jgi:hypothetical protein